MRTSTRRQRRKRGLMAEINVVPYIDVMLVLLVIFMVTAPMLNQGVKVELPQVSSEVLPQDNDAVILTVSIKADKSYYWTTGTEVDVDTADATAVELDDMVRAATAVLAANREQGRQVQVYVRADKSVDYGSVMQAMGGLQQAGVSDVGLITEAP